MKRRFQSLVVICILPLFFCFSGCIYLVVGSLGALGGYVVSPDTVEGLTQNDKNQVWDSSVNIAGIMGQVTYQKETEGLIKATISNTKVEIMVVPLSSSSVKLRVKARRNYLPKISVAQDVFVKIMSSVNE